MDAIAEIKKLYYGATKATISRDFERAIDLLKTLPSDEERERAAVFIDGLVQMRSEWKQAAGGGVTPNASSRPRAAGPQSAKAPGRSGPSKAASRPRR